MEIFTVISWTFVFFSFFIFLLETLQTFHDSNVGIQKSVHAITQTLLLLRWKISVVCRLDTFFEASVGELMYRHLDLLFGIFCLQVSSNFFLWGIVQICEISSSDWGHFNNSTGIFDVFSLTFDGFVSSMLLKRLKVEIFHFKSHNEELIAGDELRDEFLKDTLHGLYIT